MYKRHPKKNIHNLVYSSTQKIPQKKNLKGEKNNVRKHTQQLNVHYNTSRNKLRQL